MDSASQVKPKADRTARELFRDLMRHLESRRRKQLILLLLLMLLGSMAEVITIGAVVPFISVMAQPDTATEIPVVEWVLSKFGGGDARSLMLPMSVAFIMIVLGATGIRLLLVYVSNRLVYAIGHDVTVKLYRVVLDQPYTYHIGRNTSDVIADFSKVHLLVTGFLRPAMEGALAAILGAAILAALLVIDAAVAMSAGCIFGALYFLTMRLCRLRLKKNSNVISQMQGGRIRAVQEGLGGIRDVILDASQGQYTAEFARRDGRLRDAQAANAFYGQAPRFVVEAFGVTLIVILAYTLSSQPGGLTPALPILAALALGAQRLLPLIQKMYAGWAQYAGNFQVFEDVLESLSLPRKSSANLDPEKIEFQKKIEFDQICYRYSPEEPEVLSNVSLQIPKGARVGIIGKTGSGKSTLMDVLMGLLEPTGGQMSVDGLVIDGASRAAWQRHISHVPQHIYLADASITENIALSAPSASIDHDRVRQAAARAQIADYIETHRQGYQTRVGERGIQLSGGQRQRIGIARALYRDADVLVFDEASSALDMSTESAVMAAVNALDHEMTVFIVAHRVVTLSECDLIVQLDAGRVVSAGSFAEIIGTDHAQDTVKHAN